MTLTPSRPVPPATTAAQQRLEVELLLGEAVLSDRELAAAGRDRWSDAGIFSPDQCAQLGCLPVGRDGDTLLVAVPTQWTADQRQQLIDHAAASGLSLGLRLALQGEIEAELAQHAGADAAATPPPPEVIEEGALEDVEEEEDGPSAADTPMPSLVDDLQLAGPLEEVPEDDFSDIDVEKNL
ncbi:MAG: type II/IV secretion system protein, partial [Cyanobium sp.]